MRKLVGSVLLTSAVLATTTFATNGDNLIGVSPASRAMGGIGVGMETGATDAIFRNPAWMSVEKGFKVSFGGILFLPDVKTKANGLFNGAPGVPPGGFSFDEKSDADMFTIPEIAILNQINDQVTFGIGAFGVSGMGVDYRKAGVQGAFTDFTNLNGFLLDENGNPLAPPTYINPAVVQPINYTNFQFMKITPSISYKVSEGLYVGGGIDLAWGAIDMGQGSSQSYGIGARIGVAYEAGSFSLGFSYQSPIAMTYKNVYNTPKFEFDQNRNPTRIIYDTTAEDLKLTQPQEVSVGAGFKPMDNLKVGVDLRWINWSGADGYKEFGWDDQFVIAIGGEYKIDKLALRAGYNYGKSPIDDYEIGPTARNPVNVPSFANPFTEYQVAAFNLVGFPAIAEHHFTIGAGYQFTEHFTFHISYVYSPEAKKSITYNGNTILETRMVQHSLGMGLDWNF